MAPERFELSLIDVGDPRMGEGVVALLNEALPGVSRPTEWFFWKHRDNPQGRSIVAGAFDADTDRLAAVRVFWRMELEDGARRIVAYQPCDTATREEYRRRGLFKRLTALAVEAAVGSGAELLLNFPNKYSKPGNLSLGWADVGGLTMLVRPSRRWRFGFGMLRARGRLAEFRELDVASSGWPADWAGSERLRWPEGLLHGRRGAALLAWRLKSHPFHRYHLIPYEGGAVVGRLGQRTGLEEFRVAGWLGDAALDATIALGCVRQVEQTFGPDFISTVLHRHHPLYPSLARSGFLPLRRRPSFVAKSLSGTLQLDQMRWAIEGLDKDTW